MPETAEFIPPAPPREVQYPDLHIKLGEISSSPPDLLRLTQIETSLGEGHSDVDDAPTPQGMKKWLGEEVKSNFDKPPFGKKGQSKKDVGISVTEADETVGEAVVTVRDPEKGLDSYLLVYRSPVNEAIVPQELKDRNNQAEHVRELSYLTDKSDGEQDPVKVAEVMIGSHILLAEQILGRTPQEYTGVFTPEEIAEADANLALYTLAEIDDGGVNGRQALELAGYKDYGRFIDEDERKTAEKKARKSGVPVKESAYINHAYAGTLASVLEAKTQLASNI